MKQAIWVSYPVVLSPSNSQDVAMAKPSSQYDGDPILKKLGSAIRRERLKQGISQENLALAAGVDRSYMGGIERGQHNVTVMSLSKIATAIGMSMSELLSESNL